MSKHPQPRRGDKEPPLAHVISLADLGEEGRALSFEANQTERERLAGFAGALDVARFGATGYIRPFGDGVVLELRLVADVSQACVVSLEPVAQHIEVPIRRHFMPGLPSVAPEPGAEVLVDVSEDEPAEPLEGDRIDIGPILTEEFVLALEPYPRAPGSVYTAAREEADAQNVSPFAALKVLRKET